MMRRRLFRVLGFLTALLLVTPAIHAQTGTIHVDSTRQLIRGFGGIHINSWQGTYLNEGLQEKSFDNDPGELGLSILRMQIAPDSNAFANELPIAQYAVSKGALVFASPWNPPAYMLDPDAEMNRLHEDYYAAYVEHLNQFKNFMNDSGVPIYAISVQNEPDYGEWTRWTSSEMVSFLSDHGQDIESNVMAPESFQFRKPFSDAILNNAEAEANVDIIGAHIYGGGLEDYPLAREKGKEVWMTEHYTSSDRSANLWPDALYVGQEITDCMQANYNAYVWWYIRRFYGLMTDDGLISKRGFVLSQYSKFVRPGAERIDVELTDASGVDASAFITDTTLVVVFVNNNDSEVSVEMSIADNFGIDSLTQFTTSEVKNVVNEGGVSIVGDQFTATLDPLSIATFTSYAVQGGKPNNVAPVADAGADTIRVLDADGNGTELITLDGKASQDPDGTIATYSWSLDGNHLAWVDSLDADLPIGNHVAVLTVIDEDGARSIDTLPIFIESIYNTELYAEAECVTVGATWDTLYDETASNGVYIAAPLGTESVDAASTNPDDLVVYEFHVEEAGPYKVWARMITPSPNDDSYWVKIDTSQWYLWNSIPSSSEWAWDDVHDGSNDNPVVWDLDTGYHELSICFREDGALLDKILVVNTGLTPSGLGEEGVTCDIEIPEPEPEPESVNNPNELSAAMIFPNPATNQLHIAWEQGFTDVQIIGADGQLVQHERLQSLTTSTQIDLKLNTGLYIVVLRNAETTTMKRLLVR